MLRWLLTVALAFALSGCAGTAATIEAPAAPDRLLIRMFVDDWDDDGAQELHIRLAAVAGTKVQPFEGQVDVLLKPERGGWLPRAWSETVEKEDFVRAVLPYFEIIAPADRYQHGDVLRITAEAELADGRIISGSHTATV